MYKAVRSRPRNCGREVTFSPRSSFPGELPAAHRLMRPPPSHQNIQTLKHVPASRTTDAIQITFLIVHCQSEFESIVRSILFFSFCLETFSCSMLPEAFFQGFYFVFLFRCVYVHIIKQFFFIILLFFFFYFRRNSEMSGADGEWLTRSTHIHRQQQSSTRND